MRRHYSVATTSSLFSIDIGSKGFFPSQLFGVEIGLGGAAEKFPPQLFNAEIGLREARHTPQSQFVRLGLKFFRLSPRVHLVRIGVGLAPPPVFPEGAEFGPIKIIPQVLKGFKAKPVFGKKPEIRGIEKRPSIERKPSLKGIEKIPGVKRVVPKKIKVERAKLPVFEFKYVEGKAIPSIPTKIPVRGERIPSKVIPNIQKVLVTEKEREL